MRTTAITVLMLLISQNYVFAQNEKESNSNFPTLEDKYFGKKAPKEIDSLLNFQDKSNEPGVAILVTQGDEIILNKSYGMANLEMKIKMLPTHVFKIASITKPFPNLNYLLYKDYIRHRSFEQLALFITRMNFMNFMKLIKSRNTIFL